ncbi:pentapeptide repeat-containing protein [Phormidium tenue FACHB-886]|nr:pentapeptide repeat-containing protein [Phormidium tenue FACHB-886]
MPQFFSGKNLQGHSFRNQDLTDADFNRADIRGADFTNAILSGANFNQAIAGLQRRSILVLLAALGLLGTLAVFTIGVVAAFTGAILVPEHASQGITTTGFINLIVLLGFFIQVIRRGLALAIGTITLAAVAGFIILLTVYHNPMGAAAIASDILWMVILAITGAVIFAATISITANNHWIIAGAGISAWIMAVSVVTVVIPNTASMDRLSIFHGVGIASAIGVFLSLYVSSKALAGVKRFAWVWAITRSVTTLRGTCFRGADLTDATFIQATLGHTDLRTAILTRTCWRQAKQLSRSRHEGTYLEDLTVQQLVTTHSGRKRNFDGKNLQGINLHGADLTDASFIGSNLNEATLKDADLTRAKLVQTQLYRANLTHSRLTGAYIQDWGISPETKLDAVECQYIYLRLPTPDDPDPLRKPDQRSQVFKADDFADFITPIIKTMGLYRHQNVDPRQVAQAFKTLDLYHDGKVDPSAAAIALQQLSEKYPDAGLEVVALEGQGQDKVRVQAKVTNRADRSKLSAEYFARYQKIRSLPDAEVQALLAGTTEKDDRIRSLENMVMTAITSQKFYAETYYNFGETMTDHQGSINISGVQGNVSGIATAQTMTGVAIGQISGAVTNSIGQLQTADTPEATKLAALLEQLQAAIQNEPNLPSEDKAEALEQVKVLADAGQKPQEGAMQRAAKTSIKILQGTVASLPSATAFVDAWTKLLPLIMHLLALS